MILNWTSCYRNLKCQLFFFFPVFLVVFSKTILSPTHLSADMDGRKPTPWQNFCEKAKPLLNNMKKGRKPKVRRKLVRGRRSISVPDFRLLQDDSCSTTSSIPSPGLDPKTVFFPCPSPLPQASADRSGTGATDDEDESEDEGGSGTPSCSVSGSLDEDNQSGSQVRMEVPSETAEDKSEVRGAQGRVSITCVHEHEHHCRLVQLQGATERLHHLSILSRFFSVVHKILSPP